MPNKMGDSKEMMNDDDSWQKKKEDVSENPHLMETFHFASWSTLLDKAGQRNSQAASPVSRCGFP